jgi:hypothetical protein
LKGSTDVDRDANRFCQRRTAQRIPGHAACAIARQDDITRTWQDAEIVATPEADYGFRAPIPEAEVSDAMTRLLHDIDYTTEFQDGVKACAASGVYTLSATH